MVFLIGALLVWRSTRAPEPPPTPPPAPQVTAARPLDEPPPPPPVDEVVAPPSPVLAPEPVKPTPVRRVSSCEGACVGQETPELVSALRAKGGQARSCYERALKTN